MTDSSLLDSAPEGIRTHTKASTSSSPMASPFSSAPQSPALRPSNGTGPKEGPSSYRGVDEEQRVSSESSNGTTESNESQILEEPVRSERNLQERNTLSERNNLFTTDSGDGPTDTTVVGSTTNATNFRRPSGSVTPRPPTSGLTRPSFGLNLFSSFTSSIRGTHFNNQPQADTTNSFMSNSPTISNLNNITSNGNNNVGNLAISEESDEMLPHTSSRSETGQPQNEVLQTSETQSVSNGMDKDGCYSVRLTPLIDHSTSASGLYFSPVIRKVKPKSKISIGRYTEKNKAAAHAPQGSSAPIVFKSKVVSRTHALFECSDDGQWFVKDCRSSSGTFLNHIRLSHASEESALMPLLDGDIIQLGMDYRGGTEEFYRCVKMRCEFNKSWQRKVNQFNLEIHKKLKNLQINDGSANALADPHNDEMSECAICLLKLEPCQALFISPCSHSWHYKCIRPIIIKSYPQFYCPNCRSMCDLETDIEDGDDDE